MGLIKDDTEEIGLEQRRFFARAPPFICDDGVGSDDNVVLCQLVDCGNPISSMIDVVLQCVSCDMACNLIFPIGHGAQWCDEQRCL